MFVVGLVAATPIEPPDPSSLSERLKGPVVVVTQEELRGIMQYMKLQQTLIEEHDEYEKKLEEKILQLVKKTNCV